MGKSKKKKWSKGKVKEKLQNAVMFDKATFDKMLKENVMPNAKRDTLKAVLDAIRKEKALSDDLRAKLKAEIDAFAKNFV